VLFKILRAPFTPILFPEKITKPNNKQKKLLKILEYKNAARLLKLTLYENLPTIPAAEVML